MPTIAELTRNQPGFETLEYQAARYDVERKNAETVSRLERQNVTVNERENEIRGKYIRVHGRIRQVYGTAIH